MPSADSPENKSWSQQIEAYFAIKGRLFYFEFLVMLKCRPCRLQTVQTVQTECYFFYLYLNF